MFEVNLVPDVKAELLKTQKMRNRITYICILVAIGCIGVIVLMFSIFGSQGIILANQDNEMKQKSSEILGTDNLNLNLTIQDQLGKLSEIGNNRRVLSRIFGVLDIILPTGEDVVTISELSINLPTATLSFDGQANSSSDIDYNALEVFKKTVEHSYYDFGRYIDDEGKEIPTFCIDEILENNTIVGIYNKGAAGCGEVPAAPVEETDETDETVEGDAETTPPAIEQVKIIRNMTQKQLEEAKNSKKPYFKSECIADGVNKCILANKSGDESVLIRESSNGRNSAGELVLRFSATVVISQDVFSFNNKHMRIIGPTRQNVTDSYTQVRNMFTEEAKKCDADDLKCINAGGNN